MIERGEREREIYISGKITLCESDSEESNL